jgi:hypothetical protein
MITVITSVEMGAESNTEMAFATRLHGCYIEQVKRNIYYS